MVHFRILAFHQNKCGTRHCVPHVGGFLSKMQRHVKWMIAQFHSFLRPSTITKIPSFADIVSKKPLDR